MRKAKIVQRPTNTVVSKPFKSKTISLDFHSFHESIFVKEEDFESEAAFILADGTFVNGTIKCDKGILTTTISEPLIRAAHGNEIKFYMFKD